MTAPAVGEHVELHEVLADLVRDHGAQDVAALAARARRRLRDPRLATELVEEAVGAVTTLVLLPDGRVEHLGRVLDGIVLTHRVRGALGGRSDLWLGRGAQPFLTLACLHPLPLVSGGEARIASSGAPALVGPPGWLPDVERGDLVGLRWREGRLAVARVDQSPPRGRGGGGARPHGHRSALRARRVDHRCSRGPRRAHGPLPRPGAAGGPRSALHAARTARGDSRRTGGEADGDVGGARRPRAAGTAAGHHERPARGRRARPARRGHVMGGRWRAGARQPVRPSRTTEVDGAARRSGRHARWRGVVGPARGRLSYPQIALRRPVRCCSAASWAGY